MSKEKIKQDTVDKLVASVEKSAASVSDTPEITNNSVLIDESPDLDSEEFVTKTDFNTFQENLITTMTDLFKKQTDVHHDLMGQAQDIPGNELGKDTRGVDAIASHDLIPQTELENFMNQKLTIYIHPSNNKEDNPVLIPSVNGVNQPIFRGRDSLVARKYVEALARNRHTGYEQMILDPSKPHKYIMRPCMVVKDSFTVKHDPSPRGSEWLNRILKEA